MKEPTQSELALLLSAKEWPSLTELVEEHGFIFLGKCVEEPFDSVYFLGADELFEKREQGDE